MTKKPSIWMEALRSGLIGGAASLLLCLVGIVTAFSGRYIISGVISMGQIFVVAPIIFFAYSVAQRLALGRRQTLLVGVVSGLASGVILAALVLIWQVVNLRAMLINASPELYSLLTFNAS